KPWIGKKYVSFGDSITWYNGRTFYPSHNEAGTIAKGYQSYIVDALGCTLDNQGESGWTMPGIFASRVNTYNFSDVYAVTITAGANDHKNSVPVGTVQSIGSAFNLSSYAGALQASIEKIINSNKDTKIFLITPIRGWYSQATADAITGEMQGVKLLSVRYADVMKEIGALYGLHVIDFYNEVGFNDLNKNTFLGDNAQTEAENYLLHPNNKGYQRMGELIVSKLKGF
ncbi:TPA: SGNH/GDSL hydrolase family protein, partial [Acinetobacter baumannii]|nr:SGNH/GDSL hydrolase family protein [Acinetobacter baumannii]HAV6081818.1 SGNH/GDSL hydrolase family protein [Acinetobacter baumannii]HAV6162030.1 SGNH/GDSL hydrolase family protein [Acinetobacter baumannii]HAV6163369.1 SGNH/GDSL hydrolase family protein [Acinetobacter baumannii]HAV6257325.1 SGNH/GDSL hydrolase family protein [Acinetobacter baumannii]